MPGGKVSGAQGQDLGPLAEFGIDPQDRLFSDINGIYAKKNHAPVQNRNSPAFDHHLQQDRLGRRQQGATGLFVARANGACLFVLFAPQALDFFVKSFGAGAKFRGGQSVAQFGEFAFFCCQFGLYAAVLGCNLKAFFLNLTGDPLAKVALGVKRLGRHG